MGFMGWNAHATGANRSVSHGRMSRIWQKDSRSGTLSCRSSGIHACNVFDPGEMSRNAAKARAIPRENSTAGVEMFDFKTRSAQLSVPMKCSVSFAMSSPVRNTAWS